MTFIAYEELSGSCWRYIFDLCRLKKVMRSMVSVRNTEASEMSFGKALNFEVCSSHCCVGLDGMLKLYFDF